MLNEKGILFENSYSDNNNYELGQQEEKKTCQINLNLDDGYEPNEQTI